MQRLLPPLLLVVLVVALTVLFSQHPNIGSPIGLARWIGFGLIALAVAGLARARMQFTKSESEIMTFSTPRNLVTDGLFSFSRNPMYLSMLLFVTGAALLVDLWCGLIAPLVFFAAANWWYIPFEERAATEAFGGRYREYQQRVRRWL